jgi:hypothetical protein
LTAANIFAPQSTLSSPIFDPAVEIANMSLVPAVTREGWSYSGELHVEASGHNRHRRATIPELKALFDGSDGSKDSPAHWYEAQLLHYGLQPSKTKGTAKMRLFDAVNKGNLSVPAHIVKVEAELKKEWAKREREAKQALKKLAAPAAAKTARGSSKRKADERTNININLSVSVGPQGNIQIATTEPAAKKAKTASTTKKPTPCQAKPGTLRADGSPQETDRSAWSLLSKGYQVRLLPPCTRLKRRSAPYAPDGTPFPPVQQSQPGPSVCSLQPTPAG